MYENVKATIRCGAKFTDYINCTRGVKQGDVCSPVLFPLFINELALDIIIKRQTWSKPKQWFCPVSDIIICRWRDVAMWNCY